MIKRLLFLILSFSFFTSAVADEGMWVLHKIDPRTEAAMHQLGLQLSAQQLYDPQSGTSLKDAVVDFGDFCSGVVVSPDGLVFTNHHCGFSAIQSLSTTGDDILKNGFVAHNHAEERPAEGLSVFFLQRTEDITARVNDSIALSRKAHPEMTASQLAQKETSRILDVISEEYQKADTTLQVRAQSFYGNSQFYISLYKEYRDIRLVFAPTQTLGKFGGDTDNWMWPRQTCDFSVFRIYADKDGNPADYSKDNVPLHPKRWAQVSTDGFGLGDYCMTIGYPGSTSRYLSSYGIEARMHDSNAPRIEVRGMKQDMWTKWMKSDRAIAIQYASKFAQSSNYWKNSIGMNQALQNLGVVGQKQQLEGRIRQWVSQDAERQARFGGMLDSLKAGYAKVDSTLYASYYYSESLSGMEICRLARLADNFTLCQDSASAADAIKAFRDFKKDYNAQVDEETTATLLANMFQKMDTTYLPMAIADTVKAKFGGDYKAYVHDIFQRTMVLSDDALTRITLAGKTVFEKDPALLFSQEMRANMMGIVLPARNQLQQLGYYEDLLTQAFLEMEQEQPHYSDANFSMRLSYGIIQDYTAAGHHFDYYTTSQSLLDKAAKQKEIDDYLLEDDIISLIRKGDFGRYADTRTGKMQLCFLSNNDITGGNSGSPMFNGKGQLIGLAFDGNWEAMSGDISFDPSLQRCIGVDIRFVLYVIDKWGHADNIIQELRLK